MKVLATYSIKGGVGKTTLAVNLAHEAARGGARVLVWDLDPQGAATYLLRVRPKVKGGTKRLVGSRRPLSEHVRGAAISGVDIVPGDFSLRHLDLHLDARKRPTARLAALLEDVRESYDVALIDCPPSISLASESVFDAAELLLVPVVPATLASRTLAQLGSFLDGVSQAPEILPIVSMLDRRRRLHREVHAELRRDWPNAFRTTIPTSSAVERMGVERAPVAAFDPRNAATSAFRDVWRELAERLWG